MTFKPSIWYPIAVVLSVLNLVSVVYAVLPGEPWHATSHAVLALAFALWAQRLRYRLIAARSEPQLGLEALEAFEALQAEVDSLRLELGEAQERLDFAERRLAQGPDREQVR
jgi:hypothetical protein